MFENMKKHLLLFTAASLLGVAALIPSRASAQFTNGSSYIGPELGLGFGYGGGVLFGGMFETPITNPGTVGPGRLGIAVRVDYWSWSDSYPGAYSYTYSYIPIGVLCDYHFVLNDTRWDPFIGLGLGYVIVSSSYSGPAFSEGFNPSSSYGSGVFFTGQLGARYFFSPSIAIRAEYGFSYLPFAVGLDFRF
jgi:Outer membrane protein beta-barrel domain